MSQTNHDRPSCFGILDAVFPVAADGLRESPSTCLSCPWKTPCLRTAMDGDQGLRIREERLDQAFDSGRIGFLERWARKKQYQRTRLQQKTK